MTARFLHTAKQYFNVTNTASIPSWSRFEVGAARYATNLFGRSTTFRTSVINVTNKAYWATAASGQGYITQGAPRTVLFSTTN